MIVEVWFGTTALIVMGCIMVDNVILILVQLFAHKHIKLREKFTEP